MRKTMLFFSLVLTAACTTEDGLSKDEVRDLLGSDKSDQAPIDYCAKYGWYGDGVCDGFCLDPDPDCGSDDGCFVGGCSGQVCSDEPGVITTCEALPEYACYDTAACERQADGQCGWTMTEELTECLEDAGQVFCSNGTLVDGNPVFVESTDGMECQLGALECLTDDFSACPQLSPFPPDFCKDGEIVHGAPSFIDSADGMKCKIPSVHCVSTDASACPQLSPPSPDFCKDGTLVTGAPTFIDSADGKECAIPSLHCLSDDVNACPVF